MRADLRVGTFFASLLVLGGDYVFKILLSSFLPVVAAIRGSNVTGYLFGFVDCSLFYVGSIHDGEGGGMRRR